MLAFAQIVWLIGTGVGVACGGAAAIIKADAWKIWARRCDPNGTFKHPLSTKFSGDVVD
jgi:hypothetical protein